MEKTHLDSLHNVVCNAQTATLALATQALSEPLDRVHALPTHIAQFQHWQGPVESHTDELARGSFWASHLHFVIDTLIPNWSYAFEDGQRLLLLKATFVPEVRSRAATFMARQSLMVLVDSLVNKSAHTVVLSLSIRLLHHLVRDGGLDLLLGECYDPEWRRVVSTLVSVPARVANAIGDLGSKRDDWYTDKYVANFPALFCSFSS
jgi:hypothetical protein